MNTSFGLPVLKAYIRCKTRTASSLRFIAIKNFGDSGRNEIAIALNKLMNDRHVKKNRHGLYSIEYNEKFQSIGMMRRATGDKTTHAPDNAMLT